MTRTAQDMRILANTTASSSTMPLVHSRKSLEAMKRTDIQRLCKEYGVKANLKTEDLIDLLLDSQTPAPPRGTPAPRSSPRPQPTRRSASVRQPSQVPGLSRTSSIIVHDIDEEGDETSDEAMSGDLPAGKPSAPPLIVPPPRTRKAKELQTRLGKGKPVIAGGSGPRAITASSGSSKGRQTKSSKTMKPREPTIEEEPETPSAVAAVTKLDTEELIGSQLHTNQPTPELTQPSQTGPPFAAYQMEALMNQMSSIKSEFAALQERLLEVTRSQKEILVELQNFRELPSIVSSLKDEVKRQGSHLTSRPCTPQSRTEQNDSTVLLKAKNLVPTAIASSQHLPQPGTSTSTLGKRHRDSTSSVIDGVIEESEQDTVPNTTLEKTVIRPDKKRAKLQVDDVEGNTEGASPGSLAGGEEPSGAKVGLAFAVYRGSEEPDPPPPTNHLPTVFLVDSPGPSTSQQRSRASSAVPTSSAHASENQSFNFSFAPMSSTPQNPTFMANFPYPEPPQSPSPAGPSLPAVSGRQQAERTDIFKEFGFPSPVRSTRNYGALSNDERGVNPAALQGPSMKRTISSNEVAASLGLTAYRTTSSDQSSEAPTIRRTMYGTELEGDTRFGDFGVEGVASNFWLSK